MDNNNRHIAHTPHTDLTLDQIGEMQPGLARLMAEISDRYWITYYAAKNGNWKLAALQLSEINKALIFGSITRPKYESHIRAFIDGQMTRIESAIQAKDWSGFETAFHSATKSANAYHKSWNHSEIVWQLPEDPPKHLKLDIPS